MHFVLKLYIELVVFQYWVIYYITKTSCFDL